MDVILVFNIGSSSLKFSVFSLDRKVMKKEYKGAIENLLSEPTIKITKSNNEKFVEKLPVNSDKESYLKQAIHYILSWSRENGFNIVAAGHRIVHGGDFDHAVVITEDILKELANLIPFSPLHQPYNLNGYKMLKEEFPNLFQTASFDSAFHATCDKVSQAYALPSFLTENRIRRYGFHGLSYEYIASQLPNHLSSKKANCKIIAAHLGSGSTLCAMKDLKSAATSIGMTSMGGLPMSTRCGDVDPYLAVYLVEQLGWPPKKIQNLFYKESGLLGVSGISADMKTLLQSKDPKAKLAIDIFVQRVCWFTGALAADLQGLDGYVFTGGIGENSSEIRKMVCDRLSWLGLKIDDTKNQSCHSSAQDISQTMSKPIWVIPTDEEVVIAQHTLQLYLKKEQK